MGQANRCVAVLDDEEKFRLALTRLLRAHGYEVASFATGEELFAASPQRRFDCLLLDLSMPGMSGLDVLTQWHRDPIAPPVIVVTASDDPDLVQRARALNAFDYQMKPVIAKTLLDTIERACGR